MPRPIRPFADSGIEYSMTEQAGRIALPARVAVPWRPAMPAMTLSIVAALLSIMLGAALVRGLFTEHPTSTAPAIRSSGELREPLSNLPVAAQAPVSAALGAADARYRVSAAGAGFQVVNPSQRLRVRFQRSGVQIGAGAAQLGLSLDGVGYGSSPSPAGDVLAHAKANRVAYSGDGLSEWYVNGPLGLEQGFTVSSAPAGSPSSPLTLSMAVSGNVQAALAPGGKSIVLSRGGRSSLRYGNLVATDATGRTLHSWLAVNAGRILLRVDAYGARYPLRIDPLVQQPESPAAGAEALGEGRFGASVALSADGDTALVGAPGDDNGAGAAWVFTRDEAGKWTQQGPKLAGGEMGTDGVAECEIEEPGEEAEADECGFGRSVALSANGDTALVGGPGAEDNVGAVWVLTRGEDGNWTQQGPALRGGGEQLKGHFGRSVALSADGGTALIGAPGDAGYAGAAWVFTRSGTSWSEQAKLTGAESGAIDYGRSVALSGNGNAALIGAPGAADGLGAAWVLQRGEGGAWTSQARLAGAGESAEAHFGYSVALSADASTALVGERATETPAVWVFADEGAGWSEQDKLTAGGEESGEGKFGYSVALSADGSSALIGEPGYGGSAGAAWLFTRSGSTFNSGERLTVVGAHGRGRAGDSVTLTASGEAALLGAPNDSRKAGAAWSFVISPPTPEVTGVSPNEGPTSGGTEVTISGDNFSEATAVKFGTKGKSIGREGFTVNAEGTAINVESPAQSAGTVDVTVTTPGGISATGGALDKFTFVSANKKGGGGKEPGSKGTEPTGSESTGSSSDSGVTAGNSGAAGGGAAGQGAVLAFGPTTSPGCTASLLGTRIKVRRPGRAALKLTWKGKGGAVTCRGTLTLKVKIRLRSTGKSRFKTVAIGTVNFALAAGTTKYVTVKLNARGRSRLRAAHGRLAASLTIRVSTPAPRLTQTHAVHLVLQRAVRS